MRHKVSILLLLCLFAWPAMAQRIITIQGGTVTANVTDSQDFLVNLTANVTGVTLTSTVTPATGYIVSMKFVQDATGSRTVAFGGNITTTCAINSTANSVTICRWQYTASGNTWADAGGGGGITANSPIPQAQVGPGFNVKNYGAKGDTQFSAGNCSTVSTNLLTCPGANFSASKNIGQRVNCGSGLGGGLVWTAGSTITGVNSSTVAVISTTTTNTGSTWHCAWGTVDDVPVAAAVAAWQAAIASRSGQSGAFNNANAPASPVLYFPSGAYLLCGVTNNSVITAAATTAGGVVQGDAPQGTWLVPCDQPANPGSAGFMIGQSSGQGGSGLVVKNISIDGMYMNIAGSAVILPGTHLTENMTVTRWNGGNGFVSQGGGYNLNLVVNNTSLGVLCNACNDEFHAGGTSNNGNGGTSVNLTVQNTVGLNGGSGPRFTGNFLVDECGISTNGCTQILNAHDVWFQGASLFSTPNSNALYVDGTSFVHLQGGIAGVFGTDTNSSGLRILAGGTVQASDVRFSGTGTGKCINNSGNLNDNGGNTCENMFVIASGTSTGTTAVLTLTNAGAAVNTNCTVGDALVVQGASIAGYNGYYLAGVTSGITAVTATTLTYTTAGSNLGALGASGTAFCRNLQSYSGTLPRTLLNNPIPNTCYLTITPIVNATTYQMCNWAALSATNIQRITASSQNVTTCATAPIITISNGTASITFTLTSGKQFWDSFNAQDASTGVGTTIFKPSISLTGTDRVTVRYDAGALSACATPPTLLSVSYLPTPILSN